MTSAVACDPVAAAGVDEKSGVATIAAAIGAAGLAAAAGTAGVPDAEFPPGFAAALPLWSASVSSAAFLLAGAGEPDGVGLAVAGAAAAVVAAAAAATAAAASGAGESTGGVDDAVTAAVASPEFAVTVPVAPALFEPLGWVVVAALVSTAALAFATALALTVAMALATTAACLMPCTAATAVIALPGVLVFVSALLLVPAAPSPPGLELAEFCELAVWLEAASDVPEFALEPPAGAEDGWAACGEEVWAGAAAVGLDVGGLAGAGGLGGADVVASSKAANGCALASWLDEKACIREGDVSETAAGRSGAILDILDTGNPWKRREPASRPATRGPAQDNRQTP